MAVSRRTFLHRSAAAAAALAWQPGRTRAAPPAGSMPFDPGTLTPFLDPLPRPAVARPAGFRPAGGRNLPHYRFTMRAIAHQVHRDLPAATWWSFGPSFPGPTIEARRGEGVWVDWINALPSTHFLPVDRTLDGAGPGVPEVRTVVHLHGGRVPAASDGYPEAWHVPGQSHRDFYPNDQDAATLWYHDHAMGIHRLNLFAGLLGLYVIRDAEEEALRLPAGEYEWPLILCDRSFSRDGRLFYPTSGLPGHPWIPEYFGNALLVNGRLAPYLEVAPRRYRFRLLNASNSRFLHLRWPEGVTVLQIGTDQGLLPAPVAVASTHLAPAERADVVADFAGCAGRRLAMRNDLDGMLQFRVGGGVVRDESRVPDRLRDVPRLREADAVRTRTLTLGEVRHMNGTPRRMLLNGTPWSAPATETPALGTTEIWNLVNVTEDSHPIHLHLVRFQILDRRPFDVFQFRTEGTVRYLGPSEPPEPSEAGWKDTVRAAPGMVTRIVIRFEGYAGRYVWHCHILEHSDNEMMRPLDVRPSPA
ncbi:MAG: multicopper oxidase domain-containing protein [Acidobacteriota bacterium]|nr:multicopper oxidase domain-containing protein [Acidobacteriota bacterium]